MTIEQRVQEALETVNDPELPTVRIVDLGIVQDVRVTEDAIDIDLVPTFSGCPALDLIRKDVEQAVVAISDGREVTVRFLAKAWTTQLMKKPAHNALIDFGISAPGEPTTCPVCGSKNTTVESKFGPTLCRDIRYCNDCSNPFEGFKNK